MTGLVEHRIEPDNEGIKAEMEIRYRLASAEAWVLTANPAISVGGRGTGTATGAAVLRHAVALSLPGKQGAFSPQVADLAVPMT